MRMNALKGQHIIAQGIALGINGCPIPALKGQKRYSRAMPCDSSFAFTGRVDGLYVSQGDALDGASGWHGACPYTGWNSAKVGYVKLNTLFFIFGLFKVDSVRYWQSGRKVRANRKKGTDKQGEKSVLAGQNL